MPLESYCGGSEVCRGIGGTELRAIDEARYTGVVLRLDRCYAIGIHSYIRNKQLTFTLS